MLRIMSSARVARRLEVVGDLDLTTVPQGAITDALQALTYAAKVFADLAALCEAGSRKLELAAWSEPSAAN